VKNEDRFLAWLLILINLNKLKHYRRMNCIFNNVMDVYTQAKQIYLSLSGIIKLACNCRIQWKLNVGVALSAQFSGG
jgi:hypothetical protein